MAEILSSTLLSVFFSKLFDKLGTELIKNFLSPKKVIKKLLEKLEDSLLSADELLDDAEEKLIYNPRVEIWHNKLKDVVYKASELGDKIETEALRRNLEDQFASNITRMLTKLCSNPLNLCSNLLSSFDNDVKDELEEILSSLEHLLSQKDVLGLVRAGRSNYSGVISVAHEPSFFGREDIKETIIQSLRSADVRGENFTVIPIIGAGGLGKTALAQIIYKHPDVEEHFPEDARAWVTVSTEFDPPAIAKTIIEKIVDPSPLNGNEDQQVLLFELSKILKENKFLLVLDNVWSDDYSKWNTLTSCFKFGKHGSKIIVTARNSRVASVAAPNQQPHSLPELPEEDCRRLFEETVFTTDQDREAHPDLQEIGKRIVEKCKGVPLSVESVGAILRGNRDLEKWESILKSSVWELLQKNSGDIIPSLWLSYRYLPSEIKPCFAYCSIFPKGYEFEKEDVVQLWMAEGFLKNEAELTMEEVGKQYVEELISRSLFQRSIDDDDETIMMHDLVHDLAMYVSGKFSFWLDEDKMLRDLACETRHFSYNLAIVDAKKFEGLSKAKRLHTFVGFKLSYESEEELDILKVLEEVSVEGACLRVLSLSSSRCLIDSLPDSVGKLKHLRYLNLSNTTVRELPHYVGNFYNLQTLLLSRCKNLSRLPESIGNLKQLGYLDLSSSGVTELPNSIGTLENLQTLLLSGCGNLTRLPSNQGSLFNLHHLDIRYSPELEFLGNCRYGSLKDLEIEECEALKSIPLDCFPKLDKLTLGSCQNFESFGFAEETPLVLQSITDLDLDRLPKFVSFPEGGLPAPNLKVFSIFQCENLRSLPQQMHTLLPSLNSLCVDTCGEIKLWSEDEDGLPSNLETLAIWRCKKLAAQVMRWDLQTVTPCLKSLEIDGCGEEWLDSFPPEGLLPTSLTSLHIAGFRRLKTLNIHTSQNLKELHVFDCDELQCLPEESLPNCLSYLEIRNCPLLARRYRRETGEGWHKISHIPDVRINYTEQHES